MDIIIKIYKYIGIILCAGLVIGIPIVIACATAGHGEGGVLVNAILGPSGVLIAPLHIYLCGILITD